MAKSRARDSERSSVRGRKRERVRKRESARQSSKIIEQGDFFGKLHWALAMSRFEDCVFNYNKVTDRGTVGREA